MGYMLFGGDGDGGGGVRRRQESSRMLQDQAEKDQGNPVDPDLESCFHLSSRSER